MINESKFFLLEHLINFLYFLIDFKSRSLLIQYNLLYIQMDFKIETKVSCI